MMVNGHSFNLASWIRFGIQIIVILLAASGVYFRMDNRLANAEMAIKGNTSRIESMDAGGTRRSHETDFGQQTQIDDMQRRISNLESVLRDLVPKVERIDTNVLVLMTRESKKQ